MEVLDVRNNINENKLKEISIAIKNGKICIFPTETVYGIGTNALDEKAVEKLYKIKKRNRNNPINLLVSDMEMIEMVAQDISPIEYKLMESFFPGPFTIILKRKNMIPNIVTANSDFVGIRMPSNYIARKLAELSNTPVAAPSANISGKLSGTNLCDIIDEFSNQIDYAIDDGICQIGIESTIVRVINNVPHVLRPGGITPKQIKDVTGKVFFENNNTNMLPSSNLEHYQLDSSVTVVYYEDTQKMIDTIINLSKNFTDSIILCCNENANFYPNDKKVITIASKYDLTMYSRNLFSSLYKASSFSSVILIEGVKKEGLGIAIMNRLENLCDKFFSS